jgi:hypothetical protein
MVWLEAAQRELLKFGERKCPKRHPERPLSRCFIRANAKYPRLVAKRRRVLPVRIDYDCARIWESAIGNRFEKDGYKVRFACAG